MRLRICQSDEAKGDDFSPPYVLSIRRSASRFYKNRPRRIPARGVLVERRHFDLAAIERHRAARVERQPDGALTGDGMSPVRTTRFLRARHADPESESPRAATA
jgi:hypothetical protein